MEILGEVGLDDTVLMKYPSQLSGGQRQRLCIARALAMFPKVIVFDEILSMLDPVSQVQIVNLLLNVQKSWASHLYLLPTIKMAGSIYTSCY